jgi:exosortase/archaeosortase family protein
LRSTRDTRFCAGILFTLVALVFDYTLAPALYSGSTLAALTVLLLLAYRQSRGKQPLPAAPLLSWPRLLIFGSLHALLILAGRHSASPLQFAALHYSAMTSAMVAGKLIVFLPSLALFPMHAWREFGRRYRWEMIAAVVVLFTFFPYRLFQLVFPYYSPLLGAFVYHAAHLFLPTLTYAGGVQPLIVGPSLDVRIIFECTGADGVNLFDWLFGFVLLVEWGRCNKLRALISYAGGVAAILAANAVRIILMVLVGNLISADWVMRVHLYAGSLFFSGVFLVYLIFAYPFMINHLKTAKSPAPRAIFSQEPA